ncbi:MAG: DUF86 domain-containing protein [Acidobacteriaceae bacterium]
MQRDLCAYLQDVLDAGEAIQRFTSGITYEAFEADDLVRSAVERKFEIIGEALRQASDCFPGSVDSVPDLRDAVGQRNRIAHGYFAVDAKVLWDTLNDGLELLIREIEAIRSARCP